MYKSMYWMDSFQYPWNFMRSMRNGQRKNQIQIFHKGDTYMSKLRQSILETIRIIGNNSGCHQMPERSFFYHGKQFPVCARCTGVFIGQSLAILSAVFKFTIKLPLSFALIIIMGIDWFIQEINIKPSTNLRRLITGICGGFGVFSIYISCIKLIINIFKKK